MDALGMKILALGQQRADTWLRCNGRERMDAWNEDICIVEVLQKPEKNTCFFVKTFHSFIWFKPWPADWPQGFLVPVMKNFPKNGILISENRSPFCAI